MDTRFVTCPDCDGYGATVHGMTVYEHGCGFGHVDAYEQPCDTCGGTGQAEMEVLIVECDDDLEVLAAREKNNDTR